MAIEILDHCPSCGVCARPGVCPTDAIKIENGKTFISQGCIDCGLCIPVCPIGVIVETKAPESVAPTVKTVTKPTESVTDDEKTVTQREEDDDAQSTSTGA